ncbi:hypothetical protein AN414_20990 [Serratia marcescens]|nr:hypothetical protein AN414_20990 [Serratia marcescens]
MPAQLFRIGYQRPVDLHPVAVVQRIAQLGRAAVDADFVALEIDILAQLQQARSLDRLLDAAALGQFHLAQVLTLRQGVHHLDLDVRHCRPLSPAG